jgi:hypothetical protein
MIDLTPFTQILAEVSDARSPSELEFLRVRILPWLKTADLEHCPLHVGGPQVWYQPAMRWTCTVCGRSGTLSDFKRALRVVVHALLSTAIGKARAARRNDAPAA